MKKRMLIFLLVTAFFTVSVIMVELSIRSAVLSPFILLDSKKCRSPEAFNWLFHIPRGLSFKY